MEPEDAGQRLDRWFRRHYPTIPHGQLERLLRTGQIRLDGARVKAGDRISAGQAIRIPPQLAGNAQSNGRDRAEEDSTPAATSFARSLVIHRDEDVLVLNKPAGLASQGGTGIRQSVDSLLPALRYDRRQMPRLVHRLDRETSGLLLVARTSSAAAALAGAFRERSLEKIYLAIVIGVPKPGMGSINLALAKTSGHGPLGRDERIVALPTRRPATEPGESDTKAALTRYRVLDHIGTQAALVALMPVTGRTHQLRVHMAAIGHPILGDAKYGGVSAELVGAAQRLHLHAFALCVPHPGVGTLRIEAPLPVDFVESAHVLGFDLSTARLPFSFFSRGK